MQLNNNHPIVTVLIPIYKAKLYLKRSLLSILKQKETNFKAIIYDDCSNDGTFEYAQKIINNDKRFKLIKGQKNMGIGWVRDYLISLVTTQYFIFFDDDDFMYPNALKALVTKAYEKKSDIISGKTNYYMVTGFGNYLILPPYYKYRKLTNAIDYIANNIGYLWGHLIRKSYYDTLKIKLQDFKYYEDLYSTVRIFILASSFGFVNTFIIRYTRRANSLSAFSLDSIDQRLEALYKAGDQTLKFINQNIHNHKLFNHFLDNTIYNLLAILCLFYDKFKSKNRHLILDFIANKFKPLFAIYFWQPKTQLRAWKIYVNAHNQIINLLKSK